MCTINTVGKNPTSIYMCDMFVCVCVWAHLYMFGMCHKEAGDPQNCEWKMTPSLPPSETADNEGPSYLTLYKQQFKEAGVFVTKR